ncbi:WD-40 repeat-containing protein [Streptomyces sp. 1114.5]|uniref:NB-ARC domain-containing protein n=1 Tax=Streptomyces sp. 1114.5 TaxID=1938830 RepID=UPI000EB338FB|nr:NB-ARC domain-containing protein [Streptomyces sp. 1114.5]RKT09754.1 WD-40 repeat-containing protein [Streptomyces sp. 1114.5]
MGDGTWTRNEMSGTYHGPAVQAGVVNLGAGFGVGRDARRSVWMAPEPTRRLVDRAGLSGRLAGLLRGGGVDVGVIGPGGFGKTTLVAQACSRVRAAFPGGVLWVTLGENVPDPVLADKINDLSELLCGQRPALTDPSTAGYALGELLREREPTLLVVDDLWSASRLDPFPVGPNLARVVTSRMRGTLPATCEVLKVDRMSPGESGSLLSSGVPELTRTERLARLTAGWPLLLSLANSAIRHEIEDGRTADEAAELIGDQLVQDGPDSLDLESSDRRDQAVAASVEAGLRRLDGPSRQRFLQLGCLPEDVAVPGEVIGLLWAGSGLDPAGSRRLVRKLADLSLITGTGGAVLLHDVLRAYLRQALGPRGVVEADAAMFHALCAQAAPGQCEPPADWAAALPYTRRHLAGHAAGAGLLDPLLLDAGFLLAAAQPELLACLDAARSDEARAAAGVYRRVAHHLRDAPAANRPAYLALAAQQAGATALGDAATALGGCASWLSSWARWNPWTEHTILARHERAVVHVTIARLRDGRTWAVSGGLDGDVRVVDLVSNESVVLPLLRSGRRLRTFRCVALPDGRHLVVVHDWIEGLRVWDLVSGEELAFEGQEEVRHVAAIDCTDRGGRPVVVVASPDGTVRAWDAESGRTVDRRIVLPDDGNGWHRTIAAGTLANGHLAVAVAAAESPVRVWDLESGEPIEPTIPGDPIRTMVLAWGPSGLFTAGVSGAVQRWDASTGAATWRPLDTGQGPYTSALLCTRLAGTDVLISGGDRGTVRIWDADTGEPRGGPLAAHDSSVRALAWAELPDGRSVLVTGGNENTVRLWEARAFDGRSRQEAVLPAVTSVLQAAGRTVSGHTDGVLRVWDADSGEVVAELAGASRVLAHHGDLVIVAEDGDEDEDEGGASALRVWRPADGQAAGGLRELRTAGTVACTAELDGAAVAVVGGEDNVVEAVRLPTGERLWRTRSRERSRWKNRGRHRPEVTAVTTATLTDGRSVVVSGSSDGTIRVRDLLTGRRVGVSMNCRGTQQPSPAEVSALVCTRLPDGRVVAIACSEDTTSPTVAVWDLAACRIVATTAVATDWVHQAVCMGLPDGTPVVVTADTIVRIWPLDALGFPWAPLYDIDLDSPVRALAAGPPGTVVAGTSNGLVQLELRRP